jgi:hypothetical protein
MAAVGGTPDGRWTRQTLCASSPVVQSRASGVTSVHGDWRKTMFCSTIDDIITSLQTAYIPGNWETVQQVLVADREIAEWSEMTGLLRSDLYDALALRLALGFHNNSFDFGFCDRL